MKLFKRAAVIVAAMALTIGMSGSVFGATWGSYFGQNSGWYEGAMGELTDSSDDSWTADMSQIGWGGCWGGQVYQEGITITEGTEYTLSMTLESSNCDKWVLIKIAEGDDYAFGMWVHLKKGKTTTVDETFTAACDASSIYFGIGGEFGDREGTDSDAETRYALTDETIDDEDATYATVITCTDFVLEEASADDDSDDSSSSSSSSSSSTSSGTDSTVSTGDSTPIVCGIAVVLAAGAVVLVSRRREDA